MFHIDLVVHSSPDQSPAVASLVSYIGVHSAASVIGLGTALSDRCCCSEVLQTSQTGEPTRGTHSESVPCWVVGPY